MKQTRQIISRQPVKHVRQEGATLIEGIAYLGIAAMVVLGAVSLLTGAFGNAKANQTTEELVSLRTGIRKLYLGQVAPADPVPDLISANVAPSTLARSSDNKSLLNSWGGTVSIAVANGVFTITYPNVPKDVCMSVVNGANGWNSITSGAKSVTAFPATLTNASDLCPSATNNLVFVAT